LSQNLYRISKPGMMVDKLFAIPQNSSASEGA
jgi:hypothetical protein